MSKELEARVEELIALEGKKKTASSVEYQAKKAFDKEYDVVLAMVKSGHSLPRGSEFFVEVVQVPSGRENPKYALDKFVDAHPQYANTVRKLLLESKERETERLIYGVAPAP